MAPERFANRSGGVRSDIYPLGLILYEIFTGQPALRADTRDEWARVHRETPAEPSRSHVASIEREVERAVLSCLAKSPAERPASAAAVSPLLPGDVPYGIVYESGETPPPEAVAASTRRGDLAPWQAIGLSLATVGILTGALALASRTTIAALTPLPKSPDVLVERAQDVLQALVERTTPGGTA